jgi:hypothetical protein
LPLALSINKLTYVQSYGKLQVGIVSLEETAKSFDSRSVRDLLRCAPDISSNVKHIRDMFTVLRDGVLYSLIKQISL